MPQFSEKNHPKIIWKGEYLRNWFKEANQNTSDIVPESNWSLEC